MIDAMFQEGTDRALDDQMARPRAPRPVEQKFSMGDLMKAPFQGIGGGAAKSMAFGAEIIGAFGQVVGANPELLGAPMTPEQKKQADEARRKLLTEGIDFSNDAGDALRNRGREIMPDPAAAHASAQVVAGLFEFGSQAVAYTVVAGPVAGSALLSGDVGMSEADRLKQQGVDLGTRSKAGAAAGAIAGASVLIPMSGATAAGRFVKGAVVGEAGIVGTAAAEKAILQQAGYTKVADTFDPFDPVGLALGLVPGALGAKFGKPKTVAPRTEAEVRQAVQLTPAEQMRSDAFERSAANLRELEASIAAEKNPQNRATLQAELDKQRQAALAARVAGEPDAVPAARVMVAADALEASRLGPDTLAGRDQHLMAVDLAHEQLGRGEPVRVSDMIEPQRIESLADFTAAGRFQPEAMPPEVPGRFIQWLKSNGGVSMAEKADITGEPGGVRANPGGIFRRGGTATDDLAQRAADEGYLRPEQAGDSAALVDLIKRTVAGEKVLNFEEQGLSAQRVAAEADQAGRLARVEQRLRSLGVDTAPARGNLAALEAYEAKHRPALLAAAVDEFKAARVDAELGPMYEGLQDRARQVATDAVEAGRTLAQHEAVNGDLSPVMRKMAGEAAVPAAGAKGEPGAQRISAAAQDVASLSPDLMVELDGMPPMRVGELLAKVREEAAGDAKAAQLLQVAAQCALRA